MSDKDMPAFPCNIYNRDSIGEVVVAESYSGITIRDYFIAHAPAEPQPWFEPVMETERPKPVELDCDGFASNHEQIMQWDAEQKKQRYLQWPAAWADEQIKARVKT